VPEKVLVAVGVAVRVAVGVTVTPVAVSVGVFVGVAVTVLVGVGPVGVGVGVGVRVAVGPVGVNDGVGVGPVTVGVRVAVGLDEVAVGVEPVGVTVGVRDGPGRVGVVVGVGPAMLFAPTTKIGSVVALSITAAYEKTGFVAATTITALSVAVCAAPAASKIPLTWVPEWPETPRTTGRPIGAGSGPPSKIENVTMAGASFGLKAPTFARNPLGGDVAGSWRIDVSTVAACARDAGSPGMNIPTVGTGEVE